MSEFDAVAGEASALSSPFRGVQGQQPQEDSATVLARAFEELPEPEITWEQEWEVGARTGSSQLDHASPFCVSLKEQPQLELLNERDTRATEAEVSRVTEMVDEAAELDDAVSLGVDKDRHGLFEENDELLVGVGEQRVVDGEEEGQAPGPPQGVSPLAVQAAKQWDAQDRPRAWQGRVYGLVVHTTGGGLPAKARDNGVYHTTLATEHYSQTHGCHYVNGWRGLEGGDLLQLANEREQAAGVAVTNPRNPQLDQRRSIERGRFEVDLPADLVSRWRARWPGYEHSLELLPGTRTVNSCYVHIECVPCVFAYDGKLVSAAEPLRPGLRFTRAQHDAVAFLACDIARRNGWPRDQSWWRSPRLLGHEDLTPVSRHTSTGGWDPGYLRENPFFDWDYVYQAIEQLVCNAGARAAGRQVSTIPARQLRSRHGDGRPTGGNLGEAISGKPEPAVLDLMSQGGELAPDDGPIKESRQIADPAAPSSQPPGVRRAPQTPAQQANDMQERANLLRAIQLLAFAFGLRSLVPDQEVEMGLDTLGEPIRAHLVYGQTDEVAIVIAGVHGSEQSGVEVAERLLKQLKANRPLYNVVMVPRVFSDNVAQRAAWDAKILEKYGKIERQKYRELRDKDGDPFRQTPSHKDPNRQFPKLGKDLDLSNPIDALRQRIEPGNLALLALIKAFSPKRIVSIHAQKHRNSVGVFADPHPSVTDSPLAAQADRLAIAAAKRAKALGARVDGNTDGRQDGAIVTSLYPHQDPREAKEEMAKDDAKGFTLGQWGSSKGIAVFTVECDEQYRSLSAVDDPRREVELEALASAIREIILGPPITGAAAVSPSGATIGGQGPVRVD